MNQIVKDKMQKEIMVVSCDKLFNGIKRETKFYYNNEANLEKKILENYEYMIRGTAETNMNFKQAVTYAIVLDDKNRVFVYTRGGTGSNAGESRLHSKISFGIGGHLDKEDENSENPIRDSLLREIEEEINIKPKDILSIEPIGYINDDSEDVGKVHIGVSYLIRIHNSNIELLDGELANGEFIFIDDLEKMIVSGEYNIESWSKILFEPLKKIGYIY